MLYDPAAGKVARGLNKVKTLPKWNKHNTIVESWCGTVKDSPIKVIRKITERGMRLS